jgi:hypothetical protein
VLLPAATQAVLEQPVSTFANASNTTATGSSSSSNSGRAGNWLPLLLRLTAALEQAMRFEAQLGSSLPELAASKVLGRWCGIAQEFPSGAAAWGATYVLLSPQAHADLDWFTTNSPAERAFDRERAISSENSQPVLLRWMLDNTPTTQLPAVQQPVLSMLCTAAKLCISAHSTIQLVQVTEAYRCILPTAWSVLARLLPQQAAATDSNAVAVATGEGSSSQSPSGREQQETAAAAAAAISQQIPADKFSSHADAALSWLSLLGRCFLQASRQLASSLQPCAAEPASTSSP